MRKLITAFAFCIPMAASAATNVRNDVDPAHCKYWGAKAVVTITEIMMEASTHPTPVQLVMFGAQLQAALNTAPKYTPKHFVTYLSREATVFMAGLNTKNTTQALAKYPRVVEFVEQRCVEYLANGAS